VHSAQRKKKSNKRNKKYSRERKSSLNKKGSSNKQDVLKFANNFNTQIFSCQFKKALKTDDEKMKIILDLIKRNTQAKNSSSPLNDKIFKAVESKILGSGGNISKRKENLSPKSIKRTNILHSQRDPSYKTTFPTSTYYTTLSPRSITGSKRDRNSISSPINLKGMSSRRKKSTNKNKNSTSKKRDSLGKSSSRQQNDITIFAIPGKP